MSDASSETFRMGQVVGFHGLRGEMKVRLLPDAPAWPASLKQVVLLQPQAPGKRAATESASAQRTVTVQKVSLQDRVAHVLFREITSRTEAEPYLGATVIADSTDLPPPEAGEYPIASLIGMSVTDGATGPVLGTVKDVLSAASGDFLEIMPAGAVAAAQTVIIPFQDVFFPVVDLAGKRIEARSLEGFWEPPVSASPE